MVKQSKGYLDVCIFDSKGLKVEDDEIKMEGEHIIMDKTPTSKSPFTQAFQLQRDQAECDILSNDAIGTSNHYHCPGVIDVLLKTYMGIFPLWSGLLLGDLKRHSKTEMKLTDQRLKTRNTNCHVELWFGLVKHSILQKKRYLRPAEFVSKMYDSMQGRYIEHIIQQNLPKQIFDKINASSGKSDDDPTEQWNKRDSSAGRPKSQSKYFNPPKKINKPKTKQKSNKVKEDHQDKDAQITLLWKKKDSEVVVAVIPSQTKGQNLLIHHSELCSLRPHQWLTGEVIEGLLHVFAHTFNVMDKIYLMNHYTTGCILFGDRTKLHQQSLRKVLVGNSDWSSGGDVLFIEWGLRLELVN
ncbi:uncharacterized protein LOC119793751 [Cyprinodon tularosa]|uniref:uncharacterized protein LOC119793751 n=1 Tax=Cyprinodon tularosa TaxID=77115 RepID=UPI0018E209E5|nr:uncharacterized protein LOC119793751 [Cyprinodon tularosa]